MRRLWQKITLGAGAVFLILCAVLIFGYRAAGDAEPWQGKLPRLDVSLNEVSLAEIGEGAKDIKYSDNRVKLSSEAGVEEFEQVELKGRGNSTWIQPKHPYQLKFSEKADLFGMGAARKWVLLANYLDYSLLRNDTAFYLERMLESDFAMSGEYVELYVDNEYIGLYLLTPKMEIGKNRINLKNPLGILMELDNLHSAEETHYTSAAGHWLLADDVVQPARTDEAVADFMESFNQLELAAERGDFTTVNQLIDVESFAKYYLMSEFTVNPDAYDTSYYFYKDGAADVIHAGPGWDYDFALGNRVWGWAYNEDFYSPFATRVQEKYAFGGELYYDEELGEMAERAPETGVSRLFYYLMRMPDFENAVKSVYRKQLLGLKDELIAHMRERAELIREAALRDSEKWEHDFDAELEYLMEWVGNRYDYFDDEYGGRRALKTQLEEI